MLKCTNVVLGMGMEDPVPTYTYLVNQLSELFPDLAYLHVVEPRISPNGEDKVASPGQVHMVIFYVLPCPS